MKILPTLGVLIVIALLIGNIANESFAEPQNENKSRFPDGKIVSLEEIKQKYANFSPKINNHVLDVITNDNPSEIAKKLKMNFKDGKVTVYVYLNSSQNQKDLPKNIEVISSSDNITVSNVNLQQINQLSQLNFVQRIDIPVSGTLVTHDKSEGVEFSFADEMHFLNFTGNGIKIAVIDDGFLTSNPEITSNIVFSKHCTAFGTVACGGTSGNSHGTAVAEIVVDMAPDAQLYLYSTANSFGGIDLVDVQNAIDDAISKNVDIITMSLGFRGIGGDGNSGFEKDGTSSLSKKVNNAKNAGILVTVAAGNTAKSHWSGTYSASSVTPSSIGAGELIGYQSVMNFRPSASGLQKACLPVTDFGGIYLAQWNDWKTTNQDYDLILYDSSMNTAIAGSAAEQIGSQPPLEVIGTGPPIGNGCIVLASWSSTQNHFFHIEMDNLVDPNVGNPDRSITIPADATGALGVGAIDQAIDQFEDFSSQGPTDDSRLKPEICGPDNTLSHQSQLNPFVGTSAATPHVAGAAALLLQNNISLSPDQLKNELINNARFNSNYSINNLCGSNSGALSLPKDIDNDGIKNSQDNCPNDANTNQADLDNDNIGNVCDDVNIVNTNTIMQSDSILTGDLIVQDDSVLTIQSGKLGIDLSNYKILVKSGSGILIKAGSAITVPDLVLDDDNDGVPNGADNCIVTSNPGQEDTDSNGIGDACNNAQDSDGDEWANGLDNCPDDSNPDQSDLDGDQIGDVCDVFPNDVIPFELVNSISNPNPGPYSFNPEFGGSFDLSENHFVVGAERDGTSTEGLVYVFNSSDYQLQHTLSSPNPPETFAGFGRALTIVNNSVFINDRLDDEGAFNTGAIFLYDLLTGNQTGKITNPDPQNGEEFPRALDSTNDYLLAGSERDNFENNTRQGKAFLFNSTSGELVHTFNNPVPTPSRTQWFGHSVSIFENKVIIGNYWNNATLPGGGPGVAYLFDAQSGNLTHTFHSPTPVNGGNFGLDVSINGDNVLISAPSETVSEIREGKVHLFNATNGNYIKSFESPDPQINSNFGSSISVSDSRALIGETGNDLLGTNAGLAYLFDLNTGQQLAGFHSPTPNDSDSFGAKVLLNNSTVIIGSPFDDSGSEGPFSDNGAVFIFEETG
jgi:subtilisin family serine protease